jgi:histidinol-phosphate aminotransferase/imidazoleglycerol-phosphate dehydratase/histidinol-phosphatase
MSDAFPALVPNGEGLNRYPGEPGALRKRMAEVYGVAEAQVLPVRGATHGLELLVRRAFRDGFETVFGESELLSRLAAIYGLEIAEQGRKTAFRLVGSPDRLGRQLSYAEARVAAVDAQPRLLVVDESAVEFAAEPSLASQVEELPNLVVLRSLSLAYGLAGARCGAVIARPAIIGRLAELLEPYPLPVPTQKAAEAALSPSRALAVQARIDLVKGERARMRDALAGSPAVKDVIAGDGPFLIVAPADLKATEAALARFGAPGTKVPEGLRFDVGTVEANERVLAAFGASLAASTRRRAETVRDTKETRIAVTVDLDAARPVKVETGVGFFDHMLEQVATHGGFSLSLGCEGDLHIDAHHTIEDCMLAFGAALKAALGDKRGIGRFGFVLPMDETEAKVSVDLGGRPYCVFEGAFEASHIGDYPTEMTGHCFRSLAESLGAAVHVEVKGGNDHHKTEACFKALGRALRQAVRVEGGDIPSTKGVI